MLEEICHYKKILCGDLNLEHMLQENVDAFQQLGEYLNFVQRVKYSTHIHWGILHLVFEQERTEAVQWMPTPYSDHITIIIDLWIGHGKLKINQIHWNVLQSQFKAITFYYAC